MSFKGQRQEPLDFPHPASHWVPLFLNLGLDIAHSNGDSKHRIGQLLDEVRNDKKDIRADAPAQRPYLMEVGEVQVGHEWQWVELSEPFVDPIVVANALSYNGAEPTVVRIRHVDPTGFEIRLQRWDDPDGTPPPEAVGYVVMGRGTYSLEDGTQIEAGRFEADVTDTSQSVLVRPPY
jgi:hypothetical protein